MNRSRAAVTTALCRALLATQPACGPRSIFPVANLSSRQSAAAARVAGSARTVLTAGGASVRAMATGATGDLMASDLRGQSCVGMCGKDTPKLSADEIADKCRAVPLWVLSDDRTTISRSFVARNFVSALKFFSDVGEIAEAEGHHPDLHLTSYRNVRVDISTHAINGLSLPDFILAAKLDALEIDYSPKWARENLPAP